MVAVKKGADGGGYIESRLKVGSLKVCKPIVVLVLWYWMPGD